MNRTWLFGVVLVLSLIGVWFFIGSSENKKEASSYAGEHEGVSEHTHIVTLTKDGWQPSEIILKKGETVTFKTDIGELFWPASNLHPSHLIYPEFDPNGPIQPSDTWTFSFEKPGEWKYHDHLAPYFTGVIIVTE